MNNTEQPLFVFLTGASGAGKTHLAKALEKHLSADTTHIAFFDSVGVPSHDAMVAQYGSGEEWQRVTTLQWVAKLSELTGKDVIILEGQYNPQFALDACAQYSVTRFLLLVVHADRAVRDRRLVVQRDQSDLANDQMDNWADFLRNKTLALGGQVIDTTEGNLRKNIQDIIHIVENELQRISLAPAVPAL